MLPSPEKVKSVQSASINVAVEFLTIKCSAGSCFGAKVFCEKSAVEMCRSSNVNWIKALCQWDMYYMYLDTVLDCKW